MKRVSGYMDSRRLGHYDFEFYVDDDMSDEEIKKEVDEMAAISIHYEIEEGYEEYIEVRYRKTNQFEYY